MKLARLFDSFLRIMGALFSLGLLLAAALWCWPYLQALAWHARHGNTAHIGEFQVPVARWVRPDPEHILRLDLRQGSFGYMDFELGRKVTPGEKWRGALEANSRFSNPKIAEISKHFLSLKSVYVTIAGQSSLCIEDSLMIHCIPAKEERGLTVDFFGDPDLHPAFYETLSKVTRSAHKE